MSKLISIVGAGKSVIVLADMPILNHLEVITTSGTWTVPDAYEDGTPVEVQVECFGAGGGGGGPAPIDSIRGVRLIGGSGGDGGRASSAKAFPVGTVLTVVVGQGGMPGLSVGQSGTPGGPSSVSADANVLFARGDGGFGGLAPVLPQLGIPGAAGDGVGDMTFTGSGAAGGIGGAAVPPPVAQPGQNGKVHIYW